MNLCIYFYTVVLKDAKEDTTGRYRDFLCQLCLQSVEQKYSIELDKRYKLPKLSYMGAQVERQFIRDSKKAPKIEEIGDSPSPTKSNKNQAKKPIVESINLAPDIALSYRFVWLRTETDSRDATDIAGARIDHKEDSSSDNIVATGEYADPMICPEQCQTGIAFICELDGQIDPAALDVKLSAFKLQVHMSLGLQEKL